MAVEEMKADGDTQRSDSTSAVSRIRYHPQVDDLTRRMRRSPRSIRFDELDRFLRGHGFTPRQGSGSHVVYRRPDGARLTIVRPHGGAKTVHPEAIRQVLRLLAAEGQDKDDDHDHDHHHDTR
jgi:predicted RNA binding protein YcfA (HicA-like mRNA interferase family)